MKIFKFEFLFLLLATVLIYSCEYEPKGVYNRSVNENVTAPQIQVVNLNLDDDTVFLYTDKEVYFNFKSSKQEIKAVSFIIDGIRMPQVNSNSGTFQLNFAGFTEGEHSLVMDILTASGSGSIAEHIGAEGFLYSKSWKLIVNGSYFAQAKASVKDGFLLLSWARYKSSDFSEYVVYRSNEMGNDVEIARLTTIEYIDKSYIGEGGRYKLKVKTKEGNQLDWGYIEIVPDLPGFHISATETNQYILHLEKSKYYNAVDTFWIAQSLNYGGIYTTVKTTQNPNDTIFPLDNALFGDNVYFKVKLIPKNSNIMYIFQNSYMFEHYIEILLGIPFKKQNSNTYNLHPVNHDEFVYVTGCDSIIRYSVSRKGTVEQFGYHSTDGCSKCEISQIVVSSSGKYITNHVNCADDVMLIKSGSMSNNIIRDLKPYSGNMYSPGIPVSDLGTGLVNSINGGFYIYDFNTATSIGNYKKAFYGGSGIDISPNGDYVFLQDDSLRLVQFNNGQFVNIWSNSMFQVPKFYEFDASNPTQLVIWDGSTFSVKQCNNFSKVYQFALTDKNILNIDYFNKEMLTYSDGHMYVRSYLNGALLKDIPTHLNPQNWYQSCYLVNHAIACTQGIIYFIN